MERGGPTKPRTVALPTQSATGADLIVLTEVNDENIVSVAVSYDFPIAFVWARDVTQADADFASNRYMVYRGSGTQFEIPSRGSPKNLYIRAFNRNNVTNNGLSYFFIQGAERE